jgi:mannose-1-phosphate guanylyltransferase
MRVIVIMAGGAGERFWPLSRRDHPKQLLRLTDGADCPLVEAIERARRLAPAESVFVATLPHLQATLREAGLDIPAENVIAEPAKRSTAGCLAYAAAVLLARFGVPPAELTMAVLTADQRIPDTEPFLDTVRAALDAAEHHDALVTIGIRPSRPDTGFGYIEIEENAEPVGEFTGKHPVYPVSRFREKPAADEAARYVASGRFFWNSGMFFWRISTFLEEFEHAKPEFAAAVPEIARALRAGDADAAAACFAALPEISIDYALMENARHVLVAPGRFAWDDIGAWDALERCFAADHHGNVCVGDPVLVETEDSIVYNAPGNAAMDVAVVGLKDVVVVATADAVLVMAKERAQDVKKVVAELRRRNSPRL